MTEVMDNIELKVPLIDHLTHQAQTTNICVSKHVFDTKPVSEQMLVCC